VYGHSGLKPKQFQSAMLARSFCKDCEAMMLGIMAKTLCIISKKVYMNDFPNSTKYFRRATLEYLVELGKSFMYTRNNKGPSILPWGTPEITGRGVDKVSLILTIYDLFDR